MQSARVMRCLLVGTTVAITALHGFVTVARAQVAGSVEAGLAQLAQAIVEKSSAADRTTIAVLPFPHADGSCSVLSTYIVDELILSLFSVAESKLEIVERSQLEAVIAEIQLGGGGLLNPETTKKLGTLSGVSALTVGTITIVGDTIRLNARLVATETGKTISAAAVSVPKTQAIEDLIQQAVQSGPACGFMAGSSIRPVSPQELRGTPETRQTRAPSSSVCTAQNQAIVSALCATATSVRRANDGKALLIQFDVENLTDHDLRIALIPPDPVAFDSNGVQFTMKTFSGVGRCSDERQIDGCLNNAWGGLPVQAYTALRKGYKTSIGFAFESGEGSTADRVSFSSTFAFLQMPAGMASEGGETTKRFRLRDYVQPIGIGIADLQLDISKK